MDGKVIHPITLDLADLQKMTQTTVDDTFLIPGNKIDSGSFTGVLLWDLIQKAGIAPEPTIDNDPIRKSVLVTGSDCYAALYSMGELIPGLGGGTHAVIVDIERDGKTLSPTEGMARIINTGDKAGARRVFNITRIQILDPAE